MQRTQTFHSTLLSLGQVLQPLSVKENQDLSGCGCLPFYWWFTSFLLSLCHCSCSLWGSSSPLSYFSSTSSPFIVIIVMLVVVVIIILVVIIFIVSMINVIFIIFVIIDIISVIIIMIIMIITFYELWFLDSHIYSLPQLFLCHSFYFVGMLESLK